MYKNTIAANKIGMEVFNFKVENLHRGIRVVVPAAQIVQTGFFIKDVAAILKGVQGTQRIGQRARLAGGLAPSIVFVFYYLAAVCVNQRDDVALESVCASARILQGRQRKI